MFVKHILVAIFLAACAPAASPDRRSADVVVDDQLQDVTVESINWWNEATNGNATLHLTGRCEPDRSCVTIKVVDSLVTALDSKQIDDAWSVTERWESGDGSRNGAWVQILSETLTQDPDLLRIIVAHELGHTMRLHHVESTSELMRAGGDSPVTCIGDETLSQYVKIYDVDPKGINMNLCHVPRLDPEF